MLAAVLLVGILVGLPVILVEVGGNPLPDQLPSLSDLSKALRSPDDGTLAVAAISLIAWASWLILAGSIVIEAISRLRGITAPALPGLRLPQLAARSLVTAALLLFAATPQQIQHAGNVAAQPVATAGHNHGPAMAQHRPTDTHMPPAAGNRGKVESATVPYRVRSGDSLWTIARDHLGSGARYREIAELNSKVLGGRPDVITPGIILRLPTSARTDQDRAAHTMTVERGDTLSEIAEEQLGDADRYPEIFKASKAITQPRNRHLSDPDVIDVGWTLKIPWPQPSKDTGKADKTGNGHRTSQNDQRRRHAERPTPEATAKALPTAPGTATPTPRPTESATRLPTPQSSAGADDPAQPDADSSPWLLTGLTGGGVVLAASLLLLLRTRRRNQFRNRRPGRTIAVPSPHLTPVEKSISAVGDFSAPRITVVDETLRRLAASQTAAKQPMPPVTAIQLSSSTIRLYLSRPFDLPAPWENTDDRRCWTVPLTVNLDELGPDVADQPAPYPLLVTIGSDDEDQVWLLNWEELAVVNITGDPTYRADFARYLTAELACNPWSDAVTVDCVGLAGEVAALNPDRVRTQPPGTDPTAELIADAVATLERGDEAEHGLATARAQQAGADSWRARLLLIDVTDPPPASLDQLLGVVHEHQGRTGVAAAIVGQHTNPGGEVVELTSYGRLRVPSLGLDLVAVGLTADEALGCAALIAQSTSAPDKPIPEQIDADGWHAYADEAGALRTEHTQGRAAPPDPAATPTTSVLPRDDDDYLRVAATTAEDLATLAPQVPAGLRQAIEGADASLDADLNAWFADDCDLPRLTLLGPVGARTHGTAIAKRKPYYTELLSYLATRPHGATPEEVADAFSITGPRVRNDIKVLRDWLGMNPRTGRKHLPDARDSAAAQARGIGVYQVEDLLIDADLFRRLRVRGESHGADGIDDLRQALQLVTGQPFDKLRPGGWTWLYEGDRLDHHLICGIVDVAHLVTTHALAEHDLNTAQAATQIAASAAPYEEIPRLDLAAIAGAAGHRQEAARILRDEVCNRSDDENPPLELSERTEQILAAHDWVPPVRSAS
jgi:LysM repeat protein